jgi:hypothetical protein
MRSFALDKNQPDASPEPSQSDIMTATVVSRKEDVDVALAFLLLAALALFFFSSRGAVSLLFNNDEHVARKRSYGSHARV